MDMGYIFFVRHDTSNHALNYIYLNGNYYIFDSSAFVYGDLDNVAVEDGNINTIKSKIISSICFEANKLHDFVKFHKRIHLYNNHKFLYFLIPKSPKCIDKISLKKKGNKVFVSFPRSFNCSLLHKVDETQYSLEFLY